MLEQLIVVNQKNGHKNVRCPKGAHWVHWSTCLRQVSIGFDHAPSKLTGQIYRAEEAYGFFLEVVCGLHSPVLGETEVMGQFKELIEKTTREKGPRRDQALQFFKSVLKDAKYIRQTLLRDMGGRSYGSLIRRHLKPESSVVLLGSGKLAEELLPWLKGHGSITLFCRNQKRGRALKSKFSHVDGVSSLEEKIKGDVLVVAASVSSKELNALLESRLDIREIIDLRANSSSDPVAFLGPVKKLSEMLGEIKDLEQGITLKVERAKSLIKSLAHQWYLSAEYRPFGWEDLCG